MIHSRAAQKADGTGWHYVFGGRPVGYCAEHEPHPTETEARECFGRWRRDHITLDRKSSNWNSCMVKGCPNPAKNIAGVEGHGYEMAVLCDEHFDIEHAIAAMHLEGPAGDSWQS